MDAESTFRLLLDVPRRVSVRGRVLDREEFFSWVWEEFAGRGLLGVHEGTLLSEDAAKEGLETESWTLDAGEVPCERDWVAGQRMSEGELYFASEREARGASQALESSVQGLRIKGIEEQKPQDWDAQWKASFLNAAEGVAIPPFWRILPPWVSESEAKTKPGEKILRINPGAGFGTGTHETTQLCLEALAERSVCRSFAGCKVLDFGSGSGILSIGAALLGGRVAGVEIDGLAIDNATENAKLNQVEANVEFSRTLGAARGPHEIVIANILKPVLLEFSGELVARLGPGATLILSGLIESDVQPVSERFSALQGGARPQLMAKAEWRALVWNKQGLIGGT